MVMSSRGLPRSTVVCEMQGTCNFSLVLCPILIEDFYTVLDKFRGRRELRVRDLQCLGMILLMTMHQFSSPFCPSSLVSGLELLPCHLRISNAKDREYQEQGSLLCPKL